MKDTIYKAHEEIPVFPVVVTDEYGSSFLDSIGRWFDDNAPGELMQVWLDELSPLMSPGGRPAAIILALGAISIPLQLGGSAVVAPILATGAVCVAILGVW